MTNLLHLSPNPAAVAADFARYFAEQVASGSERFTVALSGGSTPKLLFEHWASHYADALDWSRVHFFWGDERCVDPTHADSNYGMTKALFLDPVGVPEQNIHRVRGEAEPAEEVQRYAAEIAQWVPQSAGLAAFDLIILGMGDDGHTASIFPHQLELLQAPGSCALAVHPESGQQRLTLTGPVLNNARQVAFLVTGAHKRDKVRAVLSDRKAHLQYPAAHIQPRQGELHWFLDQDAYKLS